MVKLIRKLKILFIDDSEDDTTLMVHFLEDYFKSINYKQIDTKEELKRNLLKEKWDLIIIDNSLPQMNALDAINIILELKVKSPYLCVSGYSSNETQKQCLDLGAKAFIHKNDFELFVNTVVKILK